MASTIPRRNDLVLLWDLLNALGVSAVGIYFGDPARETLCALREGRLTAWDGDAPLPPEFGSTSRRALGPWVGIRSASPRRERSGQIVSNKQMSRPALLPQVGRTCRGMESCRMSRQGSTSCYGTSQTRRRARSARRQSGIGCGISLLFCGEIWHPVGSCISTPTMTTQLLGHTSALVLTNSEPKLK